jgi:hypothetical protein
MARTGRATSSFITGASLTDTGRATWGVGAASAGLQPVAWVNASPNATALASCTFMGLPGTRCDYLT